jgi:hypothetical protein
MEPIVLAKISTALKMLAIISTFHCILFSALGYINRNKDPDAKYVSKVGLWLFLVAVLAAIGSILLTD